jgi:putative transposase
MGLPYRAVDKFGDTIDFMFSERRDEEAATAFFKQMINSNKLPEKVVMDKSGSIYAGLENINILLMFAGLLSFIEIFQVKYLNNVVEQDHRFIKKITKPMMGFNAFHSAKATIDGIETAHMIRKGQLTDENIPAYKQFMALAG